MSSHVVFNGLEADAKADLEKYWARKLPRLHKLLASHPPDLRDIWLSVRRHQQGPQRSWYEVRAVIHLPTGTLAATAEDKAPEAAIDQAADKLAASIRRHNELARKDFVFKRKRRRRADLNAFGPLLQEDAAGGRREDFFRLLRPQLRFLRDHARRELKVLELEESLHRREVTVDDLLDQVLLLAWQRFADRPRNMPLDLWLTQLLHEALEQWARQEPRPHASMDERPEQALPDAGRLGDEKHEKEWWDELPPFAETVTLEDLIPDRDGSAPWDELEAEEQRDRLLSLLRELPAAQRQAFLLHALDGYDTAEIAMLQDRPESQVKADVEAARRTLRDRLLAGEDGPQAAEPAAGAAGTSGK